MAKQSSAKCRRTLRRARSLGTGANFSTFCHIFALTMAGPERSTKSKSERNPATDALSTKPKKEKKSAAVTEDEEDAPAVVRARAVRSVCTTKPRAQDKPAKKAKKDKTTTVDEVRLVRLYGGRCSRAARPERVVRAREKEQERQISAHGEGCALAFTRSPLASGRCACRARQE